MFVNHLSKRLISVPCYNIINAPGLAQLYVIHVYKYYRLAMTIVSNSGPQFVSAFWDEFNQILGTKIKLVTTFYPQTNS